MSPSPPGSRNQLSCSVSLEPERRLEGVIVVTDLRTIEILDGFFDPPL